MQTNKNAGKCEHCKQTVWPQEGHVWKEKYWKIIHKECIFQFLLEKEKENGRKFAGKNVSSGKPKTV
jgi:hypothetical protein